MLKHIKTVLRSRVFYFLVACIIFVPIIYDKLPIRIDITQQESLSSKLWITNDKFDAASDNYALFIPPPDKYTKSASFYLKKISCKEGEHLHTVGSEFFCNDKHIGRALDYDMQGNPLKHEKYDLIIPKNKYFFSGTHKYSYDSRYFGLIDRNAITRGAKPLFGDEK